MLKADRIPPEVEAAIWATLKREGGATMAEALAAGLNAWPGAELEHDIREEPRTIHLPIPETSDA